MRHKRALALACGASLLWAPLIAPPAHAGTLQINPVLLEVNGSRRTALITLRNEESTPVTVRTYALEWRQQGGEDVYAETSAVIVSPPIFTIPAGGTQLIRVGLRSASAPPQAYRLIVEEVPDARPGDGIRVLLRLNLPLYSSVPAGDPAVVRWSAWRDHDGSWMLEAVNPGAGYVRLNPDLARSATGVGVADGITLGTVLPGATRRWSLGPQIDIQDNAKFQRIARTQARTQSRDTAQASRN
jgi:fimbrial chaperone protein